MLFLVGMSHHTGDLALDTIPKDARLGWCYWLLLVVNIVTFIFVVLIIFYVREGESLFLR